MESEITRTTCPYCGVGCGVIAKKTGERSIEISGDESHPANFGRLCSKGSALDETVTLDNRLLYPEINGNRESWDTALDTVASKFKSVVETHGPDSVAFYVSGQFLTEDYYIANKLMKGFIGSSNIDTNSRLCMSSSVAGHTRAFGNDTVPGCYEDLEKADLIILVGSNLAWCHPILFQRIKSAKVATPFNLVVVDPRETDSCDIADLHLAIKPGGDVALFNGLLSYLSDNDAIDKAYVNKFTEGFDEALRVAKTTLDETSTHTGISVAQLLQFYELFANNKKVVTIYSQGVNQSSSGTDKVNAIINCHLGTGKIGYEGAGPFSVTGQPNAMGGREVGGLANMLASHMAITNKDHRRIVKEFWGGSDISPNIGLKAVDLFNAVNEGRVKAIWIMATNPVVSMPNADLVRTALEKCECVVVSDCIADTDTVKCADIKLPAAGWAEKDGTVTNSERRISRQRAMFPLAGEAKPDWWIMCEVAKRMGYASGFDFNSPSEIFAEYARLSGVENNDTRDFDITGLANLNKDQYDQLGPIQWPVNEKYPEGRARFFEDGQFYTDSRKGQFIAVKHRSPVNALSQQYPLVLNSGRIRDQWHTMTRTGLSPRLSAHIPEPFVAVHPADASAYGLADKQLAKIQSKWGSLVAKVKVTETQQSGQIFVPMHWSAATSSHGRVGALVNPVVDPVSGQPELKHTPVCIEPYPVSWFGYLLSRRKLSLGQHVDYWVRAQGAGYYRYELARIEPMALMNLARELLCNEDKSQWVEFLDEGQNAYRSARIVDKQLESCLFVGKLESLPDASWLATLFKKTSLSEKDRFSLLAGRPADGEDIGPIVCACFSVGRNTIKNKIQKDGLKTPEEIGACLKAGTNCGSCIPELKQLIADEN